MGDITTVDGYLDKSHINQLFHAKSEQPCAILLLYIRSSFLITTIPRVPEHLVLDGGLDVSRLWPQKYLLAYLPTDFRSPVAFRAAETCIVSAFSDFISGTNSLLERRLGL